MKKLKEKIKLSKEEKKENKLERKLKSPWTKFYRDIPKHLNYPDMMMWELIDDTSKMYPNYVALEYFGQEITYSKVIDENLIYAQLVNEDNVRYVIMDMDEKVILKELENPYVVIREIE